MNNETTTHLTYIVGCTYGCINRKSIQLTIDDKEDYERSILYYLNNTSGEIIILAPEFLIACK